MPDEPTTSAPGDPGAVTVTDRPLPVLTAEEAATILRRASVPDHGPLRPLLDAEDALSRAHEVPPEVHAAARLLTDFARARATAVVHRIGGICGADVDLGSVLADIKARMERASIAVSTSGMPSNSRVCTQMARS